MANILLEFLLPDVCLIDSPYQMPGDSVEKKAANWVACAWKKGYYYIITAIIIVLIVFMVLVTIKNKYPNKLGWNGVLGITAVVIIGSIIPFGWTVANATVQAREMVAEYTSRAAMDPNYTWNTFIREQQKEKELSIQERQAAALERQAYGPSPVNSKPFGIDIGSQIGSQLSGYFNEKNELNKPNK